ncbi:MAG: hypothetical protein FWG43_06245 [Clostridiales bacterium]|nr:hypothetical protein [Clostridiales bacterium]
MMGSSMEQQLSKANEFYCNRRYKEAVEILERLQTGNRFAYNIYSVECHCLLGRCYYMNGASNKAAASFKKTIELSPVPGFVWEREAKSWLAFCYIFGDAVPVDLPRALSLFIAAAKPCDEAGWGDVHNCLAEFMLNLLINLRVLFELWKQKKEYDLTYALSNLEAFSFICEKWLFGVLPHEDKAETVSRDLARYRGWAPPTVGALKYITYEPPRLKILSAVWDDIFGPAIPWNYNNMYTAKFYNGDLLHWLNYYVNIKKFSKELLIRHIDFASAFSASPKNRAAFRDIHTTALHCLIQAPDF